MLENQRNRDTEVDSKQEEQIEEDQDVEERDPIVRLFLYLSNRGSSRVEVSFYDGNMRPDVLIDWIGELERYFENTKFWDPNKVSIPLPS